MEWRVPKNQALFFCSLFGGALLLVFLAFGSALSYGFAPIDDAYLILQNLAIRGITGANLHHIFTSYDPELYIPLTLFSYQINYVLGGLHPFGFHLVNLLLHAANVVLVFSLLRSFTLRIPFAILGACLFALHPIQTEAVVWVGARKELLMTFFSILSFLSYIHSDRTRFGAPLSFLFLLLALLSKVTAAILPAIFIAYDLLIIRRPLTPSLLLKKLPFFLLSGLFIGIAIFGKAPADTLLSIPATVVLGVQSTTLTLFHIVFPIGLSPLYEAISPINLFSLYSIFSFFVIILVCAGGFFSLKKFPLIGFGLLFFLLSLLPTLFAFRHGMAILVTADRYAYLPSVGIFLLISFGAEFLVRRFPSAIIHRLLSGLCGVLLIILLALTHLTVRPWKTGESLFTSALAKDPEGITARIGLSNVFVERGEAHRAFQILREGLRYSDDIRLHLQAGIVYISADRIPDAKKQFLLVKELEPKNPDALFYLGILSENESEAEAFYREALSIDPSFVAAHAKLAQLLLARNDLSTAREHLSVALSYNPNDVETLAAWGDLLSLEGDSAGAEVAFARALSLEKYSVPALLARARHELRLGKTEEAEETLRLVLRIQNKQPEAEAMLQKIKEERKKES